MIASLPEPWLRGSLPGIAVSLQPAAHAFVMAGENVEEAFQGISSDQLWLRLGGAASLGFHLMHLAGSTDRLLTYARGEGLSSAQRVALDREQSVGEPLPSEADLLDAWRAALDRAMRQIASTPEASLSERRLVGRAQLPSNVLGLLFHAAEHAQRHVGQIVTTAKIVRSSVGRDARMAGDLVFYVTLNLKPDCVDEWKVAVVDVIERMSKEPTFVGCSMQQDAQDPMCFTLYERWNEPSVEAFVKNQFEGKSYRHDYEARLPDLLRTPRAVAVLRHLREWRRS